MAALALLLFMTPAMKVIAMDDGYTIGTTPLSSVSNGDLVVWGTSNSNLAKSCSSNWIYLSSTQSEWIVFTVETTTNGFYLKTPEGSYVYSSAAKKVEFSSTNKTVLTINTNNLVNGGSSIGNYTYNSTGIRPYAGNNYTNAYLYAVTPSGSTPTTYTVTYDANGGTGTMTDSNSPYNSGATVTVMDNAFTRDNYTFDHWNTSADDSGTNYDEGDTFTINANTTLYAQWAENTPPTPVGDLIIDFESAANTYTDWTFTNMTSQQTSSITAHGGTYYGTTGGKATASIVTNSKIATPYALTCYVSKQTTNNTNSTWYIQVSSDGSTWTDVASRSATDMSKGEWKEFTADLSAYTNVYVRVYYSGSTAVRNIDDLTLLTSVPAVIAPTFSPAEGLYTSAQNVTISTTTPGAIIYYTTDGSDPTTNSSVYSSAINVSSTTTIKAMAVASGNSSSIVSATYTILEHAGTQTDPYSVADARAAIDAGTGITNVYVTGIISQVDSYSNNTITYWISDDGTTTNQLEVYKGKNLNNTNFTALSDVEVGATVIVFGTLTKYNNTTYEFTSGNYLTSYTAPQHDVEAPIFSPVAGTYTSAQTVTLSCATTGATIYYTTDGTEPTNASTEYTTALTISTTTTIKAVAYDGTNYSNVTTATYHFCSAQDPYTVTEALAFNEYPANGIYVTGIVSTAPTAAPTNNGELTYYISVDGQASNQLEVYKGKGLNEAAFTAQNDIQVGDIVTVYGNVVIYNNTKEFASGNYLVSFERPTPPAEDYTLTIANPSNVTITAVYGADGVLSNGDSDDIESGTEITVTVNVASGYVLDALTVTGDNNQTVTITETSTPGVYTFDMPAFNATVNATVVVATTGTYTLATSIESGKQYIIVGQADGNYYAMGNDKGNNRYAYGITLNETTATANIATGDAVHEFTITSLGEGYYSIMDATTSGGYLYAASSSKNYLKTESVLDENHNGDWKITITDGSFSVVADQSSNRNVMQFNNSDKLFACYASASQHPVYLYVKDETPTPEYIPLDIDAWNTSNNGGWYLITSPLAEPTDPSTVTNMIPENLSNVDLYRFDQTASNEWINYKNQDGTGVNTNFGSLVAGQGYLYANANTVQLQFTDTPYSGDGVIPLTYSTDNSDSNMHGWNLVGNPFTVPATIDHEVYMEMNGTGTDIMLGTDETIAPMEGIFVRATENGGDNQSVTFTPNSRATRVVEKTVIELSMNDAVLDRAIIRYGSGEPQTVFYIFGNTKIYFAMEDDDYSVVVCGNQDQLPLNFRTTTSGTYTLSFNNQNAEFAYLHLIDNQTNTETDLLVNPSYTFSAQTTDDEARFIVVYERAYLPLDITGYGEEDGHYYLLASPVGEVNPTVVGDMFKYEHDLYYFDQNASDGLEWINIKDGNTNLMPGTGYLYASEQDVTLKFYGSAYNGEGQVTLVKDATNNPEGGFEGWNLVGNPYAVTATIDKAYYIMNSTGSEIVAPTDPNYSIEAMQGVFVLATGTNQTVTFTPGQSGGKSSALSLNLSNGRDVIDRAIVRFDEGQQLPKFQLNPNHTKVYIPVEGQDYAIVSGEEMGEMPVCFKAESNDTYTLNLSSENVEFAYLHLIDNKTGADIDLLQTPSYSFEAKSTDYANRFKLVFATGNSSSDTFAFFSNGSFVINNEGNATLQVIDITGRILKSESINGCANINVNAAPGVYMLRLVNGDNVKVQKVVVK